MKTTFLLILPLLLLSGCMPSTRYTDTGQTLEYKLNQSPLLTYNYQTVYPSAGIDSAYRRSGFFHPVRSLAGEVLTNSSPADHYHHYGLWYAWTKTTFEGKEIDFWNVYKKQGTVCFREFTHVSDAGFSAILDHVIYPDSTARQTVMIEDLEIKLGQPFAKGYCFDYITTLQCATESPITLECYRYGGLVIRTRADWTPGRAHFLTSEGCTQKDADNSDARWAFFQGKADKGNACILILSHPANLNHPEPLRVWNEQVNAGVGDVMWNFSPTKKQSYTLTPADKLKLHYRIFVFDELINSDRAEDLWNKFAN
ncbi:PmoA family protein [Bacteroides sp. OttesenSCG-928-E20]|nr:PmoA family protein [Bacteroides sp. OttesenSCG-928-E20]MDL2305589.1 PmoA family protein [Bacteroides sp. OttesenSCG-928-D19]